jgi:stage V sporulation protein B
MDSDRKQNYLKGAAILTITVVITKIIGFFYKIPLYNIIGDENTGIFSATYNVYNVLLTISTAGVPVALARLISSAAAQERPNQVKRYMQVAMPTFIAIGAVCMLIMIVFAKQIADFTGVHEAAKGITVLAPAVLFCCIVSVYRGYSQGFENMIPTAISQIMEVGCKLVFGLSIAWLLMKNGYGDEDVCAGAIAGVTIGLGLSIPVLALYTRRMNRRNPLFNNTLDEPDSASRAFWRVMKTSIPIALGSSALSIFALIDTKLVYSRLQSGMNFTYASAKELYGVYSKAQTLFNLPSSLFIVPITVSVVPAIAAAVARRNNKEAKDIMESALKINNLLAMPCGIGLSVIAYSIFNVLFWGSNENGPVLLAILGVASYFVCVQLITNSILQAYGHEKTALVTIPVGGIVKIATSWLLVGRIGIIGAPVGTLLCYLVITVMNFVYIYAKVPDKPSIIRTSLKPLICAVIMGGAAWAVNGLLMKMLPNLTQSRMGLAVIMCAAMIVAVVVYAICVLAFGVITKEDAKFIPKGEKIAKLKT